MLRLISVAMLLAALLLPATAHAWTHCGTDQAEPDCEAHGLPGKPAVAPLPPSLPLSPPPVQPSVVVSTPIVQQQAVPFVSSSDHRVAICHNEDDARTGVQSVQKRMVQPSHVQAYLHSASGLDFLMPIGGDCGPSVS